MKKLSSKKFLYVYSGKLKKNAIGIDLVVKKQIEALVNAGCKVVLISRGYYSHSSVFNVSIPLTPAFLISFLPARYYYNAQYSFFSLLGWIFLKLFKFDFLIAWSGQAFSSLRAAKKIKLNLF